MELTPVTLTLLILVWISSALAGIALIRVALLERAGRSRFFVRRAAYEIRFRLRLAAGVGLLTWVLLGILWFIAR
jgi:hypothetical protein